MNRRTFLQRLAAVPLIGAAFKADATPSPAGPVIVYERPQQVGIPGESYWEAGKSPYFPYGTLSVVGFRDGACLKCVTFEADTAGGWVGVYANDVKDGWVHILCDVSGAPMRYWVKGEIRCGERRILREPEPDLTAPHDGIGRGSLDELLRGMNGGLADLQVALRDLVD